MVRKKVEGKKRYAGLKMRTARRMWSQVATDGRDAVDEVVHNAVRAGNDSTKADELVEAWNAR